MACHTPPNKKAMGNAITDYKDVGFRDGMGLRLGN